MDSAPSFPTTEAELVQRRPATNQPGAFPRKWLLNGERVLYETRPSLLALYWGRIVLFLAFFLLLLVDVGDPTIRSEPAFWGFEGFLLIVPLGLTYAAWRGRAYALTDQRVLVLSGMVTAALEYGRYAEIQNLTVSSGGTGNIRFDLRTRNGGRIADGRAPRMTWAAVPNSGAVYTFLQDAFRVQSWQDARRRQLEAYVAETVGDRLTCEYCGGLVDLAALDRNSPKCPLCGAPIRLSALAA